MVLVPCRQDTNLELNDGNLHIAELEHHDAFLRLKIDGVAVYPRKSVPQYCDKWFFFSFEPHIESKWIFKPHVSHKQPF